MNQEIVCFEAQGDDYPLEVFPFKILDHNGERWVTRKQLETALGVKDAL